jgi:membrane-bound lytic murein transglycosylase B
VTGGFALARRGLVVLVALAVLVWLAVAISHSTDSRSPSEANDAAPPNGPVSAYARRTIPTVYQRIYEHVGAEYGLDWTMLAAVGTIESNNGRRPGPGITHGTTPARAAGQFLASTWSRYGVSVDGSGIAIPYDPVDAITAMAAYLKASGAPQDWPRALYTFNHSEGYVGRVLSLAARLRG